MPTLQDVARLAGCSTATVSKVLSNTPYFSEDTREKVMGAVKELGYRPNLAGRALSRGKTHIVGVVFPYIYDIIFKDPLVLAIIEGIEDTLTRHGYNLLLSTPRIDLDGGDELFMQLLRSGYMDGMIAIDSVPHSNLSNLAAEYKLPLVVLGYQNANYEVHSDDYLGGRMMIQHLLELGHRHIGFISIDQSKNTAVNERMRGIRAVLSELGLSLEAMPVVDGDYSTRSGAKAAQHLMENHPRLTALACLNDRMAIGAMQQLQQSGVRIPQDISVMGYDNLAISEMTNPALTTVSQHAGQLGSESAKLLLDLLKNNEPSIAVIEPTLRVRASCAPPRAMDFAPSGQGL
jgi:DNA-binding LacI/PurR family transcriptional regulator